MRTFGPCRMCGGEDIHVQYHDGKKHCKDCETVPSCRYTNCNRKGHHLRIACRRCGWAWFEEPGSALQIGDGGVLEYDGETRRLIWTDKIGPNEYGASAIVGEYVLPWVGKFIIDTIAKSVAVEEKK